MKPVSKENQLHTERTRGTMLLVEDEYITSVGIADKILITHRNSVCVIKALQQGYGMFF